MGTNFYKLSGEHIGKRSAAGLFCWDCGETLCREGVYRVHNCLSRWEESCPKCGKTNEEEVGFNNSVGRELGFNKSEFKKKQGVASCSSFTWATEPHKIERVRFLKDEYGEKFSLKKFKEMLEECPIQYMDSIGTEFS